MSDSLLEKYGLRALTPEELDKYKLIGQPAGTRCYGSSGPCESTDTYWCSSRTEYSVEKDGPDLNAPIVLCKECQLEHDEYWDDVWRSYNASRWGTTYDY